MAGPPAARRNRALTSVDLGNVQLGDAGCAGQPSAQYRRVSLRGALCV